MVVTTQHCSEMVFTVVSAVLNRSIRVPNVVPRCQSIGELQSVYDAVRVMFHSSFTQGSDPHSRIAAKPDIDPEFA